MEIAIVRVDSSTVPHLSAVLPAAVELGSGDLDDPELLSNVVGVVGFRGDLFAVLDGGSDEVRYFNDRGDFLLAAGGSGEGPGEFLGFRSAVPNLGDSLFVHDQRSRRISVLGPDGSYLDSWSPSGWGAPPVLDIVGVLPSNDLVASSFVGGPVAREGVLLERQVIGILDRDAETFVPLDTIAVFETTPFTYEGRTRTGIIPFGDKAQVNVSGHRIFALGQDSEIRVYTKDGLLRLLRFDVPRVGVTSEMSEAWVESFFEAIYFPYPQVEEMYRSGFETAKPSDSVPLFRSLASGGEDEMCAERHGPSELTPPKYWCFTPQGNLTRIVEIPAGLQRNGMPHIDPTVTIGPNYVLGVWESDLGVELVRRYDLAGSR